MALRKKITISWSGGKDSAFALFTMLDNDQYEVVHLHTIIGQKDRRVGLHGIREELIDLQAASLKIPLIKAYLPESEDTNYYEKLVKELYREFSDQGITHVVFGDIFLDDLRKYRESLLKSSGLNGLFPLWHETSQTLIHKFLESGFRTIVCAANESCFRAGVLGITIDSNFNAIIPEGTDICGENGEFHTFLYEGPMFTKPIAITLGKTVSRVFEYKVERAGGIEVLKSTFYFIDLLPEFHQ